MILEERKKIEKIFLYKYLNIQYTLVMVWQPAMFLLQYPCLGKGPNKNTFHSFNTGQERRAANEMVSLWVWVTGGGKTKQKKSPSSRALKKTKKTPKTTKSDPKGQNALKIKINA